MKPIHKKRFVQSFKRIQKQKGISTAQVARGTTFSRSYVYHIISPKYRATITPQTIAKIGEGLELTPVQIENWINSLQNARSGQTKQKRIRSKVKFSNPQQKKLLEKVLALMAKEKISASQLARNSGLNLKRVKAYVAGRVSSLPKLTVVRLARGLKIDAHQLLAILNPPVVNKKPSKLEKSTSPVKYHQLSIQQPERESVKRIMKDIEQLNDADIAIVDLIVNRIAMTEH